MSSNNYQLGLIEIIRIFLKGWKFLIGFMLVALLVGALVFLFGPQTSMVKTSFIVRNPLELERNQTLRQDSYENKRFFGDEDVNDEIVAIAKSGPFFHNIVEQFKLRDQYGENAEKKLRRQFNLKRNDTKEISLEYTSDDTEQGAAIANYARNYIRDRYEDYYKSFSRNMITNLQVKIAEIDSNLTLLNDTIAKVRTQYGISDFLLPVRGQASSVASRSASASQAQGAEILQAFTAQKDIMVRDRANYASLINEYSIGLQENGSLDVIYVLEEAHPLAKQRVPNPLILFPAIAIGAIFLGCIILLFRAIARLEPAA